MNDFKSQIVESSPSKNEKKRFFELFDSLSFYLYNNLRSSLDQPSEKLYFETNKLIDDLKKLKDCQKPSPRIKSDYNQIIPKKIRIETIELKPKPIVHHIHTNSLGGRNEKNIKNIRHTPQKTFLSKDLDKSLVIKSINSGKLGNMPAKHTRTNSSCAANHKNGNKTL